ncbi:MAG: excinuclease ABC subunit UvrC [Parachlamydiales bacterium]
MLDLDRYPTDPGVYLMRNQKGAVLYVGKANNLRSRLRQYFSGQDTRPQIPALLKRIEAIETIVVASEKEALLLENTLIKEHQPRYNVLLKDDKGYISLKITTKHAWPMIQLVRYKGKPKADGLYFGPYTSTYAAKQMLELLIRLFPLRRCTDAELKRRTRPCLLYQIKRCVAPCVGRCSREEYDAIVKRTVRFLQGKDREVLAELKTEMERASEKLDFERAGDLYKTIQYIERCTEEQRVDLGGAIDRDVLGLYREGDEVTLSQIRFRNGKLVGAHHNTFSNVIEEDEELLTSFILQQYRELEPECQELLVPLPLSDTLSEILSEGRKKRFTVHHPTRGDKKKLLELAAKNAESNFHQERDLKAVREKTLIELQEEAGLANYPRRIECFDTSHLRGGQPVATMVAFTDGEKDSARYRKYKIETAHQGDDYAAMREVLTRRLTRGKKEDDLPDLLIVDGGKGHLNLALEVLQQLDIITVDLLGLAKEKGRHDKGMSLEQLFLPDKTLELSPRSPVLFLLQKIRDEAHRTAIAFHRKRRSKETLRNPLDNVPGIGPKKRKALLKHFGSASRVFSATQEELAEVPGITRRDVETLLAARPT